MLYDVIFASSGVDGEVEYSYYLVSASEEEAALWGLSSSYPELDDKTGDGRLATRTEGRTTINTPGVVRQDGGKMPEGEENTGGNNTGGQHESE